MENSFNIEEFLKRAVKTGASDEHIMVGHPPFIRLNGFIKRTAANALTKEEVENAILSIAPQSIKNDILSMQDLDFMYEIKGCSRFRVNYNRQIGMPGLVIRNIPYAVPDLNTLSLPNILENAVSYSNGIILITGPTGSGKSTTIASLIDYINKNTSKHIVTIEDPIEYVYNCRKSIISQRQIGVDTASFADGIKYALRQDPDVIFIGEIRDQDTMSAALKAAETGHLVLSTLHTNDAVQTINRVVNMFDESYREIVRIQLAETLRTTVAQKLVYSEAKQQRFPACEIMTVTSTVKDYIIKGKMDEIYELIRDTNLDEMISMNSSLLKLVSKELITESEALAASNEKSELEKFFRGVYQGTKSYYE